MADIVTPFAVIPAIFTVDLGVSAYNGAGPLITSPDYLTLAGKIVSVEAHGEG